MSGEASCDQAIVQKVDEDELSSQGLLPAVAIEALPPGALHLRLDHHARQTWPLQWLQWDMNVV